MRRGMNMRLKTSLNEAWQFTKGSEVRMIDLPHTWNTMDGQDGGNDYWRGTASYEKTFPCPDLEPGGRAVLEFPGAAMAANVYLNGHHLARHEGGYSTFRVDITEIGCWLRWTTAQTTRSIPRRRILPFTADCTGT